MKEGLVGDDGGGWSVGMQLSCFVVKGWYTFVFIVDEGIIFLYLYGWPLEFNLRIWPSGHPSDPYQDTLGSSVQRKCWCILLMKVTLSESRRK